MDEQSAVLAAVETILETIKRQPGGRPNDEAIRTIQKALTEIELSNYISQIYVAGKTNSIKRDAAELYSTRKHQKYSSVAGEGAAKLRIRIIGAAKGIRRHIEEL